MKKILLFIAVIATSFTAYAQISWLAGTPEETESATIVFDATGTPLENTAGTFYAHTGATTNDTNHWQNVIGSWGDNGAQPAFTLISGNIYHLTLSPSIVAFYSNPAGTITGIDIVVRSADGGTQSSDLALPVGAFQVTLFDPTDENTIVSSGGSINVVAQNTNGSADYELFANTVSIHTSTTTFYTHTATNITVNTNYELQVTQGGTTISKYFNVIVNPGVISEAMPANMENGINYDGADATVATLVLDAPLKDFIYVAGSFNNYTPTASDVMKTDPGSGKFWLTLTGLTSGQIENYQYWVYATNPVAGSPTLVKTADPFSTLVLSPFDDPWIPSASYPNIPTYPAGQEREVTVLQTGQTPYNWVVTNFAKPKKEDLIVYEVLIRDFDADRNFQDLIDKIDYFKNLNINAIQLMPIMEFEGNESWGYNTSFHLALDKFYGTEDKFRELVDVCHQNGIAVILDVALNHAFGRNPINRMWMNDPDGDGWGEPSSESPYMNEVAAHSYSVGSDFNHQQARTQYYVERVITHWIENFKIDGFRWDLTKGFTQNCTGDEGCTNSEQADRVAILKQYADYSWSLDADHYVIFEHLGGDTEEKQWADYRLGEGKGIMMWGKMTDAYNELTMGQNGGTDISRMGHTAHGFAGKRVMGYPESHDEERLMYKNLQYGNSTNAAHDVKDLDVALSRMSALGAVSLTIPGPKMIWHFAELGMENSIFTCNNGSVNDPDCKLDTKPQPQWVNNWLSDPDRSQIYNDWSRINFIKTNEDVFEGNYSINTNTLQPRIYVWDDAIPTTELKNVVILANFDVTSQNVTPDFPYTGTWYDLMDASGSTSINVTGTADPISIAAGQFKIYGNHAAQGLSVEGFDISDAIRLYPNPTTGTFALNKAATKIELYDMAGRQIKTFVDTAFNTPLDISTLSNGIYFVKIATPEGSGTKRIIKN
ncbi:MAG: alpha-amylase family glycosyl hydrolase [Urechidicola sp.]|nr:alpha-amylase family glycosyl hydrolase [Urechidicola sp.]